MFQCVTQEEYAVPSGGLSLSVGHILYVLVGVYVCMCAHNSSPGREISLRQREIPSFIPEASGPMFVVILKQLHLSEITLGTI